METTRRTFVKAVTYQLMGLVVMTALGTVFTGSPRLGGALALVSAAVGALGYILHEKLWAMVRWGRQPSCRSTESGRTLTPPQSRSTRPGNERHGDAPALAVATGDAMLAVRTQP